MGPSEEFEMFDWMAWTTPVAVFFACIVAMLIGMTVWEIARGKPSSGASLGPIATTRGDRLFIGLLSAAYPSTCCSSRSAWWRRCRSGKSPRLDRRSMAPGADLRWAEAPFAKGSPASARPATGTNKGTDT